MDIITLMYVKLLFGIAGAMTLFIIFQKDKSQRYVFYWLMTSAMLCVNATLIILTLGSDVYLPRWLLLAGIAMALVSIHVFTLAAIYSETSKPFRYHWVVAVPFVMFMLNTTDYVLMSYENRILTTFPVIIGLNILAIKQLLVQPKNALLSVYYFLIFTCALNATQLSISLMTLLFYKLNFIADLDVALVRSLSSYGLTAFSFLSLGACLFLVNKKHNIQLQEYSQRDPLTGAYNRRSMQSKLETELERCQRSGSSLSVVMLDIDHFKKVNDILGHASGDKAIRHVAEVTQQQLRPYDALYRYGGEEFLICLPDTSSADALHMAERLRKEVAHSTIPQLPNLKLTISIGIATAEDKASRRMDWEQLVHNADEALYQSKQQGRNQVSFHNQILAEI